MRFRFIHAADIHLDSQLKGLSSYPGAPVERFRTATRDAFSALVDRTIEEEAAFLVIAGDLYDGDWRDFNTGLFFAAETARLHQAGIPVFVLYGNHDAQSQITKSLPLPENVRVFDARAPESIPLDELQVVLHGQSFQTRDTSDNLARSYPDPVSGCLNIGVLHTALEGAEGHETYAPCSLQELVNKGYDYGALGHVHRHQVLSSDPYVVFPGNLQGRHAKETGPKGAVMVIVEGGRIVNVEPIHVDVVRWAQVSVDLSAVENVADVHGLVRDALDNVVAREADGRPLAVRVVLEGQSSLHGQLVRQETQLTADLRAVALELGPDAVWLEKIYWRIQPAQDPAVLAERQDAVADLERILWEAEDNEELVRDIHAEITEMLGKLPSELRAELEEDALADVKAGRIAEFIRAHRAGLISLIKTASE